MDGMRGDDHSRRVEVEGVPLTGQCVDQVPDKRLVERHIMTERITPTMGGSTYGGHSVHEFRYRRIAALDSRAGLATRVSGRQGPRKAGSK